MLSDTPCSLDEFAALLDDELNVASQPEHFSIALIENVSLVVPPLRFPFGGRDHCLAGINNLDDIIDYTRNSNVRLMVSGIQP